MTASARRRRRCTGADVAPAAVPQLGALDVEREPVELRVARDEQVIVELVERRLATVDA